MCLSGGILAKQLKEREEELNKFNDENIKILEKGGRNIKSLLAKKDSFGKEKCAEKLCPLCNNSGDKINIACNTNNIGYRLPAKLERMVRKLQFMKRKLQDQQD